MNNIYLDIDLKSPGEGDDFTEGFFSFIDARF